MFILLKFTFNYLDDYEFWKKISQCLKYEYNMTKAGPLCTSTPCHMSFSLIPPHPHVWFTESKINPFEKHTDRLNVFCVLYMLQFSLKFLSLKWIRDFNKIYFAGVDLEDELKSS